jgi:hypothetical protein
MHRSQPFSWNQLLLHDVAARNLSNSLTCVSDTRIISGQYASYDLGPFFAFGNPKVFCNILTIFLRIK